MSVLRCLTRLGQCYILLLVGLEQPSKSQPIPLNQAPVEPLPRELQPPSTRTQPEVSPRLPPPDQLIPSAPNAPLPSNIPDGEIPDTITVERFEIKGNTVFSSVELANALKRFTKKPISLVELFQARDTITQLYAQRGYITSGAFIPPQKLQGGVVQIQVIEGTIEDIKVTGTRRLNPAYIRSRVELATGQPFDRNRLLEALRLLQLNPLIQNLSAELSAGTRPGVGLLEVRVTEAKTFAADFRLDNARSPSAGTDRRQIQLNEANLLGLGDALSLSYTNTNGSNAGDFSYSLPISPSNGTLSFNVGVSSSRVIEPPFDVLDIESKSRYYEITLRQPLTQSLNQEFAIGITATRRESQATLLDGEIPFPGLGADNDGRTRLTAVRFFQDWTQRSNRSVFAVRSQFSIGLNALNATINAEVPDSRFFAWRTQAQWVRLLAPDTLLLLRSDFQLADRALLPFEQFGLGGIDSVRGYRQDLILSDSGFFGSAEVRIPVLRATRSNVLLQFAPFVDVGTAWNLSDRPDPDPSTLVSLGLGLRLQIGNQFTARFDWGIPLVEIEGAKRTWQENGLYFSINYTAR
ncbi:ShlB/FhaC/HecB family hemolysin secretion/activation protein [Leptolyngbya boryana CZ1]|uniref:ShlB/FhaC/HecB family hemolysin secretion/activation protein n=1 Tax=Leptolyngbya boryana CZ1 TaxID=3060204 RepID=A0AA97ALL8_LEPBY|nr:ShlB/FhaC/HecB family hemolysin secretion/activation protein [Leptolyngbya boryana]WNZ44123.1 ShlB/FhaC/HecB family hemolysin secretion/activation protein [Leptolyngbya boryana CZ1]